MLAAGDSTATAVSELLYGEAFDVFDIVDTWGFGRSTADGYTGWVALVALAELRNADTLPVTARSAPVFTLPDIKAPVLLELPFGAHVTGAAGDRFFALADGGYLHNRHLAELPREPIVAARIFAGAPYLWGGRTPAGVDCSGLVQAALAACGLACRRDTDQQLAELGSAVGFADRAAGDIIFFPGHVGLLTSPDMLFHANAHWMATTEEPLADVIDRLLASSIENPVTGVRRL